MTRKIFYLVSIILIFSCSSDDSENSDIAEEINLPELQTNEVYDITLYSVEAGGKLIDPGDSDIIEIGLVVGLSTLPTTDNNLNKFILSPDESGNFNIRITSIPANTTYFIRAYGINSEGIGYGNEVQFTSLEENVYNGSITLSTQEEVDTFGANEYTTINGSLYIEGTVTDLSPLESIVIINSAFEVKNTQNLQNLEGLNNLKITGNIFPNGFRIQNNLVLESLSGLNNLEITRGESYIINNDNLTNMHGLDSYYAASAGEFRIEDCDGLQNLSGLENLEFIGSTLYIRNNTSLSDLSALIDLNFVTSIYISDNSDLQDINGFDSLLTTESVSIINNDNLINLSGLLNLTSVDAITISHNDLLDDLSGLSNLTSLNVITISHNDLLDDLSGLSNISSPLSISIEYNNSLTSLIDLSNVDVKNITITGNPSLINLVGLENISTLQRLYIHSNDSLVDLEGLDNLTSVTNNSYTITIGFNPNLNSLNGLDNLIQVNGFMQVFNNASLDDFCALKNLFSNGTYDTLNFSGNLSNPTTDEIINNCE